MASRWLNFRLLISVTYGQINRVCIGREKALLFRGWSRLCLHAASLSAVEGALAAATAAARAARTEAMEKEAATAANIVAGKMEGIDLVRRHARAVVLVSIAEKIITGI